MSAHVDVRRLKTTSFIGNGRPLPESLLLLTSGAGYDRDEGTGNDMNCMRYFIKIIVDKDTEEKIKQHETQYIQDISVLLWGNIGVFF